MSYTVTRDANYNVNRQDLNNQWRALSIFNLYRICLALILCLLQWLDLQSGTSIGLLTAPTLMLALFYLLFGSASLFSSYGKYLEFDSLTVIQTLLDIFLLVLLIHVNQSLLGSLGILINISILGSSLLLSGRYSTFFASVATLSIFIQQFIANPQFLMVSQDSFLFVILSTSFFATAILTSLFANRLSQSEAIAAKTSQHASDLQLLNAHIIERLQYGIIIVDDNWKIRVMNAAAVQVLADGHRRNFQFLGEVSSSLVSHLEKWARDSLLSGRTSMVLHDKQVMINFTQLHTGNESMILITTEDMSELAKQAQHMKLASLGRFTASIAHELRNPLGAISHAAQLLDEVDNQNEQANKLLAIINKQCLRMNHVIKNILQLSRREKTQMQTIKLQDWLHEFIREYQSSKPNKPIIDCHVLPEHIQVLFDSNQLRQVLSNLFDNGLRASYNHRGEEKLRVLAGVDHDLQCVYLDVIDFGTGVDKDTIEKLFEPFYTSHRDGTGLGLYISNELCQANQASLRYNAKPNSPGVFRINFYKMVQT